MYKFILLIILCLSFNAIGAEGKSALCTIENAKIVIPIAEKHSSYDKNRHCTVSCMLSLKCNRLEVMMIGYLKEFKDVFGPGNAEVEDIKADKYGISLVRTKRAQSIPECLQQCDLRY